MPLKLAMEAEVARHLIEAGVFFRQLAEPVLVGDRRSIAEQSRDLLVPLDQLRELGAQRLLHLLAINWPGGSARCSAGIDKPYLSSERLMRSSRSLRTPP